MFKVFNPRESKPMPLLISPIDNTSPMQQIKRDGIEIDRCPVSGGVWLDAGELEKLLLAVQNAAAADRAEYAQYQQHHPKPPHTPYMPRKHWHDDDDYEDYHRKTHGKPSTMKSLLKLFD
jgi:hypothetical protein